jgi:murein DD-endopeptidase MepM/ murein hydrolase activator NlpD
MMLKKLNLSIGRIAKLLFWAGISLCCVMALEAGQDVVQAESSAQPVPVSSQPAQVVPPVVQFKSVNPSPLPLQEATAPKAPKIGPETTQASSTRQKLAINTGAPNDQQIAQITPSEVATSTWTGASFPVENFQAYTSPFGYRSSPYGGYTQEFHYGLDLAAPEGSYIRSWWGGKVVEVSDDSNCGTSVVVESGPWLHIYCHMQGHVESDDGKRYMIDREGGVQIWENQQLPAGARVGRVGMTGRTTGPHLHWGLKYNENWVDPALVLRAMYFNQEQTASNPNRERVQ